MMRILLACVIGFLLDLLFGDPVWLYHPVRMIGALIGFLERIFRKWCKESEQKLVIAGGVLWGIVMLVSAGVPFLLLRAAEEVHPWLRFGLECFWCYQLLALKSLKTESMKVYAELEPKDPAVRNTSGPERKDIHESTEPESKDLEGARRAVSMIVGRDTDCLDKDGIIRATVETVAENTSDGVIAPLFYLLLGGAPLGFAYKAVNTMDSMIGYKDVRFRAIGRIAAKADDLANFLPARIAALLMILTAFLTGMDGRQAWNIFRRDRYRHASPNSAQTEAACAGALRIQLAGDAYYFGKLHKKPHIGDPLRHISLEDIPRAVKLLYGTSFLALLLFGGIRLLCCTWLV